MLDMDAIYMRIKARTRPVPGQMNKTEQAYADYLQTLHVAGEVEHYQYQGAKLRLADNTTYTPDFLVVKSDRTLEFHEVKGSWKAPHQDDSKVKIKVAAAMHYYARFISAEVVAKKNGGGWKFTEF